MFQNVRRRTPKNARRKAEELIEDDPISLTLSHHGLQLARASKGLVLASHLARITSWCFTLHASVHRQVCNHLCNCIHCVLGIHPYGLAVLAEEATHAEILLWCPKNMQCHENGPV